MPNRKVKNDFSEMFYTDHLLETDKKKISEAYAKKDMAVGDILSRILENGLSIKFTWSEYNEAYSCVVSPVDSSHPSWKTYYSTFHANWEKALFVCDYLLKDRYDYGDWTKGQKSRPTNDW